VLASQGPSSMLLQSGLHKQSCPYFYDHITNASGEKLSISRSQVIVGTSTVHFDSLDHLITSYPHSSCKQDLFLVTLAPIKWSLSAHGGVQLPTTFNCRQCGAPRKSFRAAPALLQLFRHHPLHHDLVVPRLGDRPCNHEGRDQQASWKFCMMIDAT